MSGRNTSEVHEKKRYYSTTKDIGKDACALCQKDLSGTHTKKIFIHIRQDIKDHTNFTSEKRLLYRGMLSHVMI